MKIIWASVITLLAAAIITVTVLYLPTLQFDMIDTKGTVAEKERNLMAFTLILAAAVVIPVFVMATAIAWRYRESNTKATYKPDWSTNHLAEVIWWGIPIILIGILAVVTWQSTHSLDPYKPLAQHEKSIKVQVVSLDWKWLFIYPEYNIATVNFVQFPTDTSVNFDLTSDTVMSSFWIPQLSGQLYAMPGMTNKLHIDAHEPGDYRGSSANITGEGFAGMRFTARASSQADFDAWVTSVKSSDKNLDIATYKKLYRESTNHPVTHYGTVVDGLYDTIVMNYMMPEKHHDTNHKMPTDHESSDNKTTDHESSMMHHGEHTMNHEGMEGAH